MRIQRPVFTDFAFQAELFAVGGQQQFNSSGIKADTVVKRLHLMLRVDAFDRHHRHQNVFLLNQARVAGEQRFNEERFVGDHHVINPRAGNIDARQIAFVVHQFVDLGYHNAIVEGGGFDQRRGIFSTWPGVQVAFAVGFIARDQRDVWRQINVQAGVEFDIGVDGADFEQAIFQQLRNAQALGAGEREIQFTGNAFSNRSRCSLRPTLGITICRS